MARGWTASYLDFPNYAKNLERMGFAQDELLDGRSERLVDATVAWGDETRSPAWCASISMRAPITCACSS